MNDSDTKRTAVIVGAAGGLGRALAARLYARPDFHNVIALSRSRPDLPTGAIWQQTDCAEPEELNLAADHVGREYAQVDLLLNCVGALHGPETSDFQPEKALSALRLDNLQHAMRINAFAPLAALQAFAPLLRHPGGAVAATLSAMVGSIGDNQLGGWYSYRMSKAALNMGLRNAAIEFSRQRNGPVVVAIHPGTTLTTLSERFVRRHRHRPPEDSAARILAVIDGLSDEDSGKFLNWDGNELPW